jgi:hypothetical protein
MEWALMLFLSMDEGAASELVATYKTLDECQRVGLQLSSAIEYDSNQTYQHGLIFTEGVELYYTCAPVPSAYIYE